MDADEEIGFLAVGVRGSLVERHATVVVTRQEHAETQAPFDRRAETTRDRESDVLFERTAWSTCAKFIAAVACVDHDRTHTGRSDW